MVLKTLFISFIIFIGIVNLASSISSKCKFGVVEWDKYVVKPYTCKVFVANFPTYVKIDKITGTHQGTNTNKNVQALMIEKKNCEVFPGGYDTFFPHLEGLSIINSKLKSIKPDNLKGFPNLKSLVLSDNQLVTLDFNLFIRNPKLVRIDFSNNKIEGVSDNILYGLNNLESVDFTDNKCISTSVKSKELIDKLNNELSDKCPPTECMKEVRDCEVKNFGLLLELEDIKPSCAKINATIEKCQSEKDECQKDFANSKVKCAKLENNLELGICKKEVEDLKASLADLTDKIRTLENKNAELEHEKDELLKYNEEILRNLTICSSDRHDVGKPEKSCEISKTIAIECDFYNVTTCVSNSAFIPHSGMKITEIKGPNGETIEASSITNIVLSGGSTRGLPTNFCTFFPNLQNFAVKGARIEAIEAHVFNGCGNLNSLEISGSKVHKIHKEAFQGLTSLTYLNLDNNKLTEISEAVSSLTNLEQLQVNDNQIRIVEWKNLRNLNKLVVLGLKNNKLNSIEMNILKSLTNIKELDLSENSCIDIKYPDKSIKSVEQIIFKGCPFEVDINCDYKLEGEDYVCYAQDTMIIHKNSVVKKVIGTHTAEYSNSRVTKLVFRNQTMQYIPSNLLRETFTGVRTFEATHMKMREARNLVNLISITLDHNEIQRLDENMFEFSTRLHFLSLDHNSIEEISLDTFKHNSEVRTLTLVGNPIKVLNTAVFRFFESTDIDLTDSGIQKIEGTMPAGVQSITFKGNSCTNIKYTPKKADEYYRQLYENCAEKINLECEFVQIGDDYVCNAKNLNIQSENVKITNVYGYHTQEGYTSKNVTKIYVQGQIMHYLPNNFMKVFPNLSKVEVTSSKLKKLSKFIGSGLKWVKISGNEIIEIDADSFVASPGLVYVDLSSNKITKISETLFSECTEIEEINLEKNELETFNWYMFNMMMALKNVNLGYNKITKIDWSELGSVESINLSGNGCIDIAYSSVTKEAFLNDIFNKCGTETVLKCDFIMYGGEYICKTVGLVIENQNTKITRVEGQHLEGMSYEHVTRVLSIRQNVQHYPINIRKFFKNLKKMVVILTTKSTNNYIFVDGEDTVIQTN